MRKLILRQRKALGDTVLLTALARDLRQVLPPTTEILAQTHFSEIWDNHPYVRPLRNDETTDDRLDKVVTVEYIEGIRQAGRGEKTHMLTWYYRDVAAKLNLEDFWPTKAGADLDHLTDEERRPLIPDARESPYWLLFAGGKVDATVKVWSQARWQALVNRMLLAGLRVVQAGANFSGHFHHTIAGVESVVGMTNSARQLMSLVYNSAGVICPITAAMHMAAAYEKPCVVVAGGREEPWWESYTNDYAGAFGPKVTSVPMPHHYLHTLGELECCQTKGCWKRRTVKRNDKSAYDADADLCKLPVIGDGGQPTPRCLEMISVDKVFAAVDSYATVVVREPPAQILNSNSESAMDSPAIGGKVTAFVLCYGDNEPLARRCIDSVLEKSTPARLELRVICNAVGVRTRDYLDAIGSRVAVRYVHSENRKKYPVMREAFRDEANPIRTRYIAWLDDDTRVMADDWLEVMASAIRDNHGNGYRLYGRAMSHDVAPYARPSFDPRGWFRAGLWWRNRHLRGRGGRDEVPNGAVIDFVAGWHWWLDADLIRYADIPDERLHHNGGDITIGEQVHQAGYRVYPAMKDKSVVWCPTREAGGRRGFSETFPWSSPLGSPLVIPQR